MRANIGSRASLKCDCVMATSVGHASALPMAIRLATMGFCRSGASSRQFLRTNCSKFDPTERTHTQSTKGTSTKKTELMVCIPACHSTHAMHQWFIKRPRGVWNPAMMAKPPQVRRMRCSTMSSKSFRPSDMTFQKTFETFREPLSACVTCISMRVPRR